MVAEVDTAGAPAAGDVVDRSQLCRSTPVWLSRRLGPPAKCHDEVRISNLCTARRRGAPNPRRLCDNGLRAAPIGENQSDLLTAPAELSHSRLGRGLQRNLNDFAQFSVSLQSEVRGPALVRRECDRP